MIPGHRRRTDDSQSLNVCKGFKSSHDTSSASSFSQVPSSGNPLFRLGEIDVSAAVAWAPVDENTRLHPVEESLHILPDNGRRSARGTHPRKREEVMSTTAFDKGTSLLGVTRNATVVAWAP